MNKSVIYKISNRVNDLVYIGATSQGLARRKGEHIYRFNLNERDHSLYVAMREIGIDSFEFETLFHVLNTKDLMELEIFFIKQYDSFFNGYNMTKGGTHVSDETKQKLRTIMQNRKVTWMHKSVETKRKNGFYTTERAKARASRGGKSPLSKYYLVQHPCGKQEVIKGINYFCQKNNLTAKCLYDCLNGKQHHHKGFKLLARLNDYPEREYTQVGGNGTNPIHLS